MFSEDLAEVVTEMFGGIDGIVEATIVPAAVPHELGRWNP
jgi:hypothetical protein